MSEPFTSAGRAQLGVFLPAYVLQCFVYMEIEMYKPGRTLAFTNIFIFIIYRDIYLYSYIFII